MADEITRPELDAKLELIETRMDARVDRMEAQVTKSVEAIDRALDGLRETVSEIKTDNRETRSIISNAKWWAIGTAVAVLLGTWQIVGTVNQGLLAAFQLGQQNPPSKPEPPKQ